MEDFAEIFLRKLAVNLLKVCRRLASYVDALRARHTIFLAQVWKIA